MKLIQLSFNIYKQIYYLVFSTLAKKIINSDFYINLILLDIEHHKMSLRDSKLYEKFLIQLTEDNNKLELVILKCMYLDLNVIFFIFFLLKRIKKHDFLEADLAKNTKAF